jgi:O-antigen ligase
MPAILAMASWSLALAVNLAPLALGSNRALPWSYNAAICGAIALIVAFYCLLRPVKGMPVRFAPIVLPAVLFAIVLGWIGLQISPAGAQIFGGHPAWDYVIESGGTDGQGTGGGQVRLSVNTAETGAALMRLATYGAVFFAAFILAQSAATAGFLIKALLFSAGIYTFYGLFRFAFDWEKILWFDAGSTGALTSAFINSNSAATYFGLASVVGAAVLLRQIRRERFGQEGHSFRYRVMTIVAAISARFGVAIVAFVLPLTALLMTASRGGILATLAGLAALLILTAIRRSAAGGGSARFAGFIGVAVLLVTIFQMSGARFAERLAVSGVQSQDRLNAYQTTLRAVKDNALLGTGYGTFQDIYPLYRNEEPYSPLVWDKAHNDYLELVLGLGIPAALVLLFSLFLVFAVVVRGYFRRRRNAIYPGIAVAGTIVLAVHSFVDFSAQIQAIAMTYAMILGIGAAQSHRRSVLT